MTGSLTESLPALEVAFAAFNGARKSEPSWLSALRRDAYARFVAMGVPDRRNEEWKYTSLRVLQDMTTLSVSEAAPVDAAVSAEIAAAIAKYVGPAAQALVLVDGVLSTGFSKLSALPKGTLISTLAEATTASAGAVQNLVGALLPSEQHPFALLNAAFLKGGAFVDIAKGAQLGRLDIVHVVTRRAEGVASAHFPRTLITLGESAEAEIVETFIGLGDQPYAVTAVTDIKLAANSKLTHARVQLEGSAAVHISRTAARLDRDARLETFTYTAGGRLTRNDLDIALTGSGAEATLDGLYVVRGSQHVDNHTQVDHQVPSATSNQLYKGIMADQGRAVFNGKVLVRRDAQKTAAFQLNRNLLLSSDAEIDTKPELQIDAGDVKCAHGASVGQLEQDEIFYLMSRGLRRDDAIRMLTAAFADEVLLKSSIEGLSDRLRAVTRERLA